MFLRGDSFVYTHTVITELIQKKTCNSIESFIYSFLFICWEIRLCCVYYVKVEIVILLKNNCTEISFRMHTDRAQNAMQWQNNNNEKRKKI